MENACSNKNECPCPSKTCQNHGKCCACVAHHRQRDNLPVCLRKKSAPQAAQNDAQNS